MIEPFVPVTDKEREALTILQEECAEIIQIVSKIKRFGWESSHPENPDETNRDLLELEMGDYEAIKLFLVGNTFSVDPARIETHMWKKWDKFPYFSNLFEKVTT